jgi:hypothetical protein
MQLGPPPPPTSEHWSYACEIWCEDISVCILSSTLPNIGPNKIYVTDMKETQYLLLCMLVRHILILKKTLKCIRER